MPARVAPLKQSWVPLGPKKGGQFSNATSHDSTPETLTTVNDLLISGGQWVPRFGNSVFGPTLASQPLSMAVYNRYSGVGLPTSHLLISLSGSVVDQSSVSTTTIKSGLSTRRVIFNSVKNRCFMANGVDSPFIYDGTSTSSWGVAAPSANLLYSASPPGYNTGTITVSGGPGGVTGINITFGGDSYTSTPGVNFSGGGGSGAVATAVISGGQVTSVIITSSGSGYIAPPAITFSGGTSGNVATAQAVITTLGSTQITGTGTNFVHVPTFVGQPIYIFGTRYIIASVKDATHLTLSSPYIGVSAVSVAAPNWHINTGAMSWDAGNGFRYAYSYYDPVTGHTSNVGPILSVDDAAPNNDDSSVVISNIVTTGDARFTKIILWRTGHGGGILFPLAVLNNSGGPLTYTDNNNDDTVLGTVAGGPGTFPAPIVTNAPAPSDLDNVAYWDGRFWGSRTSQPGLLYFSAKNDPNELQIGVGEECWPAVYTIPISEDNGRITGTRAVGAVLYVMTEKSIFAVIGAAPANYQVQRVSTKGRGADQLAACTLPGEDNNSGDILVHFGNDSRMYFLYGPGGDVSMTYPIQDKL